MPTALMMTSSLPSTKEPSCVPSKRPLDADHTGSTSKIRSSIGGLPRTLMPVSSLPDQHSTPLEDIDVHSLGSGYHVRASSELSVIEEVSESSSNATSTSTTSDPPELDSAPDSFPSRMGDEPVEIDRLIQQLVSPSPHTPGVRNANLTPSERLDPAQPVPNFTPVAPPQSAQSPSPDDLEDSHSEISDDASSSSASVFEEDFMSSYTASLLSEAEDFAYENGRRYHSYREGNYVLPNDEPEQDRQDLLHHVRNLVLRGSLFQSPLDNKTQRILDIGTGTGIWAIDMAGVFPNAQVIGIDLSPIQPSWVPPNCRFIVDDAEADWLYSRSQPFDFIHTRDMGGAISDWPRLLTQSFQHLRPGGWVELCEFEVMLSSDDDSIALAPTLCEFLGHLVQASKQFNRPMNIAPHHRRHLIEAGFEDVHERVFKVPSNPWPTDALDQEIGKYNMCSLLLAVESYSLALFTRVLGWSNEKTQVFLVGVRRELKDPMIRTYCNLRIVYGRKPSHQ